MDKYRKGVSGIIIDENNEFLILQKPIYELDKWEFAGGGIDEGESPEEALFREIKEELSINSENLELVGQSKNPQIYLYPEVSIREEGTYIGSRKERFVLRYFGDRSEITIQEEEISKVIWVKKNEFKEYLNFTNQYEEIMEVLKEFNL